MFVSPELIEETGWFRKLIFGVSILCGISKSPRPVLSTESVSKTVNETLSLAKDNIQLLINKVLSSNGDLELIN